MHSHVAEIKVNGFREMWINDVFYYSIRLLKGIANSYESLYFDAHTESLYEVALLKADFDRSLDNIGRGKWRGLENSNFGAYKYYGRQQQMVIADILQISDHKLEGYGFYQIPQLRGRAYMTMAEVLNGEELPMNKARQTRWHYDEPSPQRGGTFLHPAEGNWNGSWDNSVKLIEEKS